MIPNLVWGECREKEQARQSGKKRKFIRGKERGDWPLRRASVLSFWLSLSSTPPKKNSLKGRSCSWKSGIWWSRSFEKVGTSEVTGCHLGNLVSLTDHCDFILHLKGQHNEPSYQWDSIWALSLRFNTWSNGSFNLSQKFNLNQPVWNFLVKHSM